jgi:hypothetical protein
LAKVTFKINNSGVKELLNSEAIYNDLGRRANQIASTAGEGWKAESRLSFKGDRASAVVFTDDPKTLARNRRDHTLMRSLDAGGN